MAGPDFSSIDSKDKALALVDRGELEKMFLMPLEFGGSDIPENVVFVPVGFAALKSSTDFNVIGKLAQEGKVTQYSAKPKYVGASFIPVEIEISASDPGDFKFNLAIWGDALSR